MKPRSLTDLTEKRLRARLADRIMATAHRLPDRDWQKAAVGALDSTTDADLKADGATYQRIEAYQTVLGRIDSLRARPLQRIPKSVSEPTSYWTVEGAPVPLTRAAYGSASLSEFQLNTLIAFNKEFLVLGDDVAQAFVLQKTTRASALAEDSKALSTDAATAGSPAGLLASAPQAGGGSPLDTDLSELTAFVSDGNPVAPIFIASLRGALYLQSVGGNAFRHAYANDQGHIGGIRLLISPAAAGRLILLDAHELVQHDGGVEFASSEQPSIEMLDNPTNNSATATATQVVSAFQTGLKVVKVTRYRDWAVLSDDAIAFIDLGIGGSPA